MEARYVEAGETAAAYPDMPENALNWVYTETVTGHPRGFAPGFGEFLVVSRSRDYYLGGAHGMTEKRYLVIDPARTEALTLDRIIPPQRREALGERIEAALRRRSVEGGIVPETTDPAGPLTRWGYFEDTLEIPDNFFLTPEGIGFHWDPYEIAPYYRGPLEIIIPYEEIAGDARLPIPRSGQ
jgi:hypothetical protein